ncbi:4-hydroxy-tetrahydrodipicolinate synthase [Chamaesiphon minutus]|uniref:4-hydroxy-tetrahydrodipicolinate synthase n=1 Tax=Chamaesiphon minutus (strain ATCC 27169 / PCC 6605) TaxID=1173020 RepID=K9ULU3_CHAP6|nr:4-hydroxy-tetrahydrodipicolinate synthase [Chamaesiphon minutus]AFY95401.1 dihydrodipicolinate synthase [Chamaesiphon minutus PCC 6605]
MTIDFGRVITAMITPFDLEGNVHYAEAEKLAAHLAANGSDGIVVCGTTGESPTLSWEEEYELFQVVQKAVAGKVKVIAGTGSNSTSEAIEATQKAAKLGVDGSLQVVPYYNKPPQIGLYQHFEAIASACDLPMMLYNIPGRTGQHLEPETISKLAKLDGIVAIKEATGNLDIVSQIRSLTPPNFKIYSGDDSLTLPMLSVGGYGVVSVASHLVGKEIQAMVAAFESGHNQLATQMHIKMLPLFKGLFFAPNPMPIKAALKLQGWEVGGLRLPMCELPSELLPQLQQLLQQQGLLKIAK